MRKRILLTLVLLVATFAGARAQNVIDLIIAEALAVPDSTGIVDDYGRRGGWIEIFNTSQGTVNFAGCYLTDDRNNLKKSLIPKGDLRTKLGPRQTTLIYASGEGKDGTFYAGFRLRPGSTVYLVSNDGRTVIDSLVLPKDLPAGLSVSKQAFDLRQREFEPLPDPTVPSPGIPNMDQDAASKAQAMAEKDPHGFILSLVAVTVVFSALAILWFLFWLFFDRPAKKKRSPVIPSITKESPSDEIAAAIALAMDMEQGGDVYAAIALAMDLYFSDTVHDTESFILTMRPKESAAWNDKKQNFRKLPR
ncbi:MAG: lamin tail domain-containing protein [Bacteroidales bacterium]|nr:lamin tail domain-containing protein [Bacteroidales bacterium]